MYRTVQIKSLIIGIFISFQLSAQNFEQIDNHAKSAPKSAGKTVKKLSEYLNSETTNDIEKIRAYYVWLTNNIEYDTKTFFSKNPNPKISATDALKYKKAVCQGYSELFKALCDRNNITCYLVAGYSKGYGYNPDKKLTNADHAWNVVFLDNKWYLIDATWGLGYIDDNMKYIMRFSEDFFMPSPDTFLLKHLPSDPMWQLLSCPISIADYKKSDTEIAAKLRNCNSSFNFNDTIATWQKLTTVQQKVQSAERAYRFNPENVEAPGFALLSLSYDMGGELSKLYDEKKYKQALEMNKNILKINESALSYLRKSKTPHAKNAVNICKQNIASSKGNIKSLEKFLE